MMDGAYSYRMPRRRQLPPFSAYPFVAGEPDEAAAFAAYSSLNDLLDYRAKQFPDSPCLGEIDLSAGVTHISTFDEVRRLVISFAAAFVSTGLIKPREHVAEKRVVVGVLGAGADMWLASTALQRIGVTPLLISWRLSPRAIAQLLTSAGVDFILPFPAAEELIAALKQSSGMPLPSRLPWQSHLDPVHREGSAGLSAAEIETASDRVSSRVSLADRAESIAVMFHTSGTTVIKVVPATNAALLAAVCHAYRATASACGFAIHHAAGFWGCSSMLAFAKLSIIMPVLSTFDEHQRALELCLPHVQHVYTHPISIQMLASRPEGLHLLGRLRRLTLAGGHLDRATSEQVDAAGIQTQYLMGTTEAALVLESDREASAGTPVLYHPPAKELGGDFVRFVPFDGEKDVFELVILEGYPSLHVCDVPEGCATGDLYTRQPPGDKWSFYKRKSDYLEHTTGAKTDPVPAETHLMASPLIKQAMIVGTGRPDTAALIIPSTDAYDPYDMRCLFDQLNALLPEASRIRPERVAVLRECDQFVMSWKGEVVRSSTIAKYQYIIDGLYRKR